ncbi:hypothetical protein BC835DRAFT_1304750 [Cytidiella melzeri]|nr:hypothetical protein BC835DRAFT_1304750 [Cytidiella melzeri]
MSSPSPTTPRTWTKTPPPTTSTLCDQSFPTPSAAARMDAEERQARMLANKMRKEGEKSNEQGADKTASGRDEAEKSLPTPLSTSTSTSNHSLTTAPVTPPSLTTESNNVGRYASTTTANANDNPFIVVPGKQKQGKRLKITKAGKSSAKTQTEVPVEKRTEGEEGERGNTEPLPFPANRFEILGLDTLGLDIGEGARDKEGNGNPSPTHAEPTLPSIQGTRKKGKSKSTTAKPRLTSPRTASTPPTLTPFPKRTIVPYNLADSPHEQTRVRVREKRRVSRQTTPAGGGSEEEELWRATGSFDVDLEMEDATSLSNEVTAPSSNEVAVARKTTNPSNHSLTKANVSKMPLAALRTDGSKNDVHDSRATTPTQLPHAPRTQKTHDLEFSTPTANFESVRGNNPYFAFNNLSNKQAEAWPKVPGFSLLVRQAGKGRPGGSTEQARKEEILSLLRRTVGAPQGIRITAPSPAQDRPGNRIPPYNFLIYNFDEQYYDLLNLCGGCISTTEGTLFLSSNGPTFDSYIGSISGFGDEEPCSKDGKEFSQVKIVEARKDDGTTQRVAHLFLATPTYDIIQWRTFRDKAMQANFADPFIGMNTTQFTAWQCGVCTSALHLLPLCPILTEPGWLYNSDLRPTTTSKPPKAPTEPAPPTEFTTIATDGGNRSSRGGRGERGRGGRARGGRGNGGRGRGI